jgi:hypothetical protein
VPPSAADEWAAEWWPAPAVLVAGRSDAAAGPAGGPADTVGGRACGLADAVAHSVGDRAAVVGSVTAVVGMADRPEESDGSEIPTEARAGALGVPVPCWGQAARRGDSVQANRRARALGESSLAQLCLVKSNPSAADVGFVEYGHRVCASKSSWRNGLGASRGVEHRDRVLVRRSVVALPPQPSMT